MSRASSSDDLAPPGAPHRRRALLATLRALQRKTSPFADNPPARDAKGAHWVTPELVGEVAFTEWTRDGRLRHPTWRGLRPDKSPAEVVRES